MQSRFRINVALLISSATLSLAACGGHDSQPATDSAGAANTAPATTLPADSAARANGTTTTTAAAPHHSALAGAAVGAAAGHVLGHHAVAGAIAGAVIQHERNKHP